MAAHLKCVCGHVGPSVGPWSDGRSLCGPCKSREVLKAPRVQQRFAAMLGGVSKPAGDRLKSHGDGFTCRRCE